MASEKAAHRARIQFSDELFGKGIQGLLVDEVRLDAQKKTFALIALVPPSYRKRLPHSVKVAMGSTQVEVPVLLRREGDIVAQ